MIYVRHAKVASSTVLDYFGLCTDETKGAWVAGHGLCLLIPSAAFATAIPASS